MTEIRTVMAVDVADAPKKKRKRPSKSPTALSLAECRSRGWLAGVVEQTIPHTFIKRDLFGFIDIVVITQDGILGIQATSDDASGNSYQRINKIKATPAAVDWLRVAKLAVWSWARRGPRKTWTLRVLPIAVVGGEVKALEECP